MMPVQKRRPTDPEYGREVEDEAQEMLATFVSRQDRVLAALNEGKLSRSDVRRLCGFASEDVDWILDLLERR